MSCRSKKIKKAQNMSLFHLMLLNYILGTAEHIFKGKSDELQLLEVGTSLKTHN